MPRTTKPPAYRLYKRTGQAVVTLNGQDHYLGPHGTAISRQAYDVLVGEWLASGRRMPAQETSMSVTELAAAYWRFAQGYYRKSGRPTKEVWHVKNTLRAVKRRYGRLSVADFGPLKLKAVRQQFMEAGHSRTYINDNVGRITRMFKWGVENELVPPNVHQALLAVSGLRKGRTEATERAAVKPVPDEYVDAIRVCVSKEVWAIVELQRLTGMRSGEVVIIRGCDLDMTGRLWLYRPASHKTEHHGQERVVELGRRAQKVIRPFLKPDLGAFLFSPADAEIQRRAKLHARRKTPLSCGNRPGTNRNLKPKRTPRERYTPDSYRRAVARACDLADLAAKKQRDLPTNSERIVPRWHPHQLRHSYATRVRRLYGIETARILLGHRSVVTTEIYAEVDRMKAREIVAKIG